MAVTPYSAVQLRGGAVGGKLRHAAAAGQAAGLEMTVCLRPARFPYPADDRDFRDVPAEQQCLRCRRGLKGIDAAAKAEAEARLAAELDGLYLVCFGTRVEVVQGPPLITRLPGLTEYDESDALRVVIEDWIKLRFPVTGNGHLSAQYAPPLPLEVGCRPLTGKDLELFATWDPGFTKRVKRLLKQKASTNG